MAKPRLGKLERAIVKAYHQKRLAAKAAIISANLSSPRPEAPLAGVQGYGQDSASPIRLMSNSHQNRCYIGQRKLKFVKKA